MKKHIYNLLMIFILAGLFACQDTKLGDTDLDFDVKIDNKELSSYIGKPVRIGVSIDIADPQNTYPFETKIKFKEGTVYYDTKSIKSNEILPQFDYRANGTLYFNYVPATKGSQTIDITIKNELVTKVVTCTIDCKDALYAVEIKDTPERPLIDTKFDFSMLVNEMETTGADSITAYAKVIKGSGVVYSGESIINDVNDTTKSAKSILLAIGKNGLSYQSSKEGENIIRFYLTNKWGYETTQDISTNINLPEWTLTDSEENKTITVPFQDNYSFTLNLTEKDIFKDNKYEGFFRILTNTDVALKINSQDYKQGATIPLKAGGNVSVMKVNTAGAGAIEFIVKDKYKQERRDTLKFSSQLPVKPIEASLDKTSQSVKINQPATFKLTLKEVNYDDVFSVTYQILSGAGKIEGGNTQSLSEGTHNLKFTPTQAGATTFKITVKDKNNQEKILNVTVQASVSPLNVTLSQTLLAFTQGESANTTLTTEEENYTGKYYLTYSVSNGTGGTLKVNSEVLGTGGTVQWAENTRTINISSSNAGKAIYDLTIKDDYGQSKKIQLTTNVTAKKFTVNTSAETGGTVEGGGTFDSGANVTVKAIPNANYAFDGWYQGTTKVSENAVMTFILKNDVTLVARFAANKYNLTATAGTGGKAEGTGAYTHGQNVTVTAIPEANYVFDGWYQANTKISENLSYSFAITKHTTLEARFTGKKFSVNVNALTGGTATGSGSFNYNSSVTVKATVNTGYAFLGWYKGGTKMSDALTYTFTVTANTELEARFSANAYAITVNAETGGAATGAGNFEHGTNVIVKATANTGYVFEGWYEGSNKVSTSATYNFTATANRNLTAKFKANTYTIIVNALTGGTATGAGNFEYGKNVTIKATVNNGYTFLGWYKGSTKVSDALSYTFTVTESTTYEARFSANAYAITVNALTGGTATGAGNFEHGTNVIVKATPNTGYAFEGWYEGSNKVSSSATYNFTATANRSLTAKFKANTYTIIVNALTGGAATGAGNFEYGKNVTIKATVNNGYTFLGWYKGSTKVSDALSYTFTVTESTTYEARFSANKYAITVNAQTGGAATGAGNFEYGTSVTVKATANTGYAFEGWYEGSNKVSSSATYNFTATANRSLTAKFKANTYTITLSGTNGTQTGAGSYSYGTNATLKATPSANYQLVGWYEGSTQLSTSNPYIFKVEKDRIIEAKYKLIQRTLSLTAGTGGNVTGAGTYNHGTSVTAKATPSTGYTFDGWYNGTTKVSPNASYTFSLNANTSLTAKFTQIKYTITATATAGGKVTGGGTYAHGTNVTLTASVNSGYTFLGWYNGTTKVSSNLSHTFTATANITLTAKFNSNGADFEIPSTLQSSVGYTETRIEGLTSTSTGAYWDFSQSFSLTPAGTDQFYIALKSEVTGLEDYTINGTKLSTAWVAIPSGFSTIGVTTGKGLCIFGCGVVVGSADFNKYVSNPKTQVYLIKNSAGKTKEMTVVFKCLNSRK